MEAYVGILETDALVKMFFFLQQLNGFSAEQDHMFKSLAPSMYHV